MHEAQQEAGRNTNLMDWQTHMKFVFTILYCIPLRTNLLHFVQPFSESMIYI